MLNDKQLEEIQREIVDAREKLQTVSSKLGMLLDTLEMDENETKK